MDDFPLWDSEPAPCGGFLARFLLVATHKAPSTHYLTNLCPHIYNALKTGVFCHYVGKNNEK